MLKAVVSLSWGKAISQLFAFASIPLISRLYTPEELGTFAILFSISNIFGMISTIGMHSALVLCKSESELKNLFLGVVKSGGILSLFLFVFTLLSCKFLVHLFDLEHSLLFVLAPIVGYLIGVGRLLYFFNTFYKKYNNLSQGHLIRSITSNLLKIIGGVKKMSVPGLFASFAIGELMNNLVLAAPKLFSKRFNKIICNRTRILVMLRKNINFLRFNMPYSIINSFSSDILIYVLTTIYGPVAVGFYSNARKLLYFPFEVVTQGISTVFFRDIVDSKEPKKLYLKTLFSSILFAIVLLTPLYFIGEKLAVFILGEQWTNIGTYLQVLIPFVVVNFSIQNISHVFSAIRKNHYLLYWQITYLMSVLLLSFIHHDSIYIEEFLNYFVVVASASYLILGIFGYFSLEPSEKTKEEIGSKSNERIN